MSNQHLLLRSEGEYHSYLVVVPLTSAFLALVERRAKLLNELVEDDDFSSVSFFNYDYTVYEYGDQDEVLGDGVESLIVDGEPDLFEAGEKQRIDFGEMHLTKGKELYFRYGIKHDDAIYETRLMDLSDLL